MYYMGRRTSDPPSDPLTSLSNPTPAPGTLCLLAHKVEISVANFYIFPSSHKNLHVWDIPLPKKSLHHFSCGTFKPLLYKVPLVTWVTKFAKTISQGGMIEPPDTKK